MHLGDDAVTGTLTVGSHVAQDQAGTGERVVLDNLVKVRPGAPLVPRAPAAK